MMPHTHMELDINTSNLFINPLFSSSRIEEIKEWELLCELKGESVPVSPWDITTRGLQRTFAETFEVLKYSSDDG